MASCVRNIRTKNYQNLLIAFQVTAKNVRDAFLGHIAYLASFWGDSGNQKCEFWNLH